MSFYIYADRWLFFGCTEIAYEIEIALAGAKAKKRSILADKVTGDNIYKALIYFEDFYDKMNESERREFMSVLLENVQIYEERQSNG